MTDSTAPIVAILPPREGFGPSAFGAVSLAIKEFTERSAYRDRTKVLGAVDCEPWPDLPYETLKIKRHWYERHTRAYLRAILERVKELSPALVEVHNRPALVTPLRQHLNVPIALHLHNDPQEMKAAKTVSERRKLLQMLDGIYCVSDWAKDRFLEGLGDSPKIFATSCGMDIGPMPQKKKQILYVGRMTPNKGVVEYAEALAKLLPNHPDWKGLFIGGRRHSVSQSLSDYEQQIMKIIDPIANATHLGFQNYEATQAAFRDAAIVVVPSLWEEPFGRTALEATAQGCAVITSGRGGLKEITGTDGGIILNEITGETLAIAITSLIEDNAKREALQKTAHARAASYYEINQCAKRYDRARHFILGKETAHAA